MWVLIDNYDSFTYILHHYLLQLHQEVQVYRNDAISLAELQRLAPERIILSPGPRRPKDAGITNEVVRHFYRETPLLGICLGHQAIGAFLGATLTKATRPVHGMTSPILHRQEGIFSDIPVGFEAMRYHSLILRDWEDTGIRPLAFSTEQELMAFDHPVFPVTGIQFHPESVLTACGMQLLKNWASH
ncbi:anthranilate synthase component II [Taibaiella koreensis]|uniref:anthranilate synthase component II n=1 Tax=Taibaiella koreensis TaxID=1268548 RepID=UPI000E59A88C|nr:aminodeoxychorismate/anthranilate synthase component II [Taibaiella koreensis]